MRVQVELTSSSGSEATSRSFGRDIPKIQHREDEELRLLRSNLDLFSMEYIQGCHSDWLNISDFPYCGATKSRHIYLPDLFVPDLFVWSQTQLPEILHTPSLSLYSSDVADARDHIKNVFRISCPHMGRLTTVLNVHCAQGSVLRCFHPLPQVWHKIR